MSSNRKDDFIKKLRYYEEAGVKEYWIVDPRDQVTYVHIFDDPDRPKAYPFDAPIPVGIWEDVLSVTVSEYLTDSIE